jgi:hypothetical protein
MRIVDQDDLLTAPGHFDGMSMVALRLDKEHPRWAHLHGVPVFIVVIEGVCGTLAGPEMQCWTHAEGSVMRIAAGVPHVGVSLDPRVPVLALKFSTSDDIKRDTTRLPDYDELVESRTADLRALYRAGKLDVTRRTSGFVTLTQTVERAVHGNR